MLNPELVRYVEAEIIPRYEHFDRAHRIDHVRSVIERSLRLARRLGADLDMAYVIAAYHDTGLALGRERHHLFSGEILARDPALPRWFDPDRIRLMREAIEDHRASADRAPRSLYGRIVAEADRQLDPATVLRRTLRYGLDHYPELDREGHYARLREHLLRKYGTGGYLRLWLAESDNAGQLARLRILLNDERRLHETFDHLFDEETRI